MTARRVVLIVLDGLGVGALPDAEARDASANTLRSVWQHERGLSLPNLSALGLAEIAGLPSLGALDHVLASARGVASLGYPGADTYLGHQAMMGRRLAGIELHMLEDHGPIIREALASAGHEVSVARPGTSVLEVDRVAFVADNIEAAPGLNINVTGSIDDIAFDDLMEIGRIVRAHATVPRVIVVGGAGFAAPDIRAAITERSPGHVGIDTPGLGVYDANYVVRHLGVGQADDRTLPGLVVSAGRPVVLLGKAADVIECPAATRHFDIATRAVFDRLNGYLASDFDGLVVANIQETDLAGHEQDPARFADVLRAVDARVPEVLAALGEHGALIVTADHGNDPLVGHSQHTREHVPLLAVGPGIDPGPLGVRPSLGDVGATAANLMGVGFVADGSSFAHRSVALNG